MSFEQVTALGASELADALAAGELSAREVTGAFLDRIAAHDDAVGAFLATSADVSLQKAAEVDEARAGGAKLSPLAGVPFAIKDVLVTKDFPATAGSRMLSGYVSPFDATPVARSLQAGLVPLGKTNMDEFAMGSSGENSAFHPSRNPWSLDRVPGGSGGGSAAALSAHFAPLALGSDTGGSIRQPAALTGTVGVKPTYGGVSRYGAIALASSLDQVGPCARNVFDTALLHDVLAGYDAKDSTSLRRQWPCMADAVREGASGDVLRGLKIGVVDELLPADLVAPGVRDAFTKTLDLLADAGAEIVSLHAPHFEYAVAAYYLILPAEASSNLAKFDAVRFGRRVAVGGDENVEKVMRVSREQGLGREVKRRIILGTYALSAGYYDAFYGSALKVRTLVQQDFAEAFEKVHVIASATAPTTAWKIGEHAGDPLLDYANDVTTIPANLAGIPGMSLPIGLAFDDGLPVGLQLLAPQLEEARLYRVGGAIEKLVGQAPVSPFARESYVDGGSAF